MEHDPALGATLDGGLQKFGAGTLTLLQSGTFTGSTLIQQGTLSIADANALQLSTLDTSGAGSLSFGTLSAVTLGGLSGPGTTSLTGSVNLSVGNNNSSTTFSGSVAAGLAGLTKIGSGSLTLTGAIDGAGPLLVDNGQLILSGDNLFSGATVSGGTLTLADNEALGNGGSLTVGAGAAALFDSPVFFAAASAPVVSPVAVPEPGSLVLLTVGLPAVLGVWRRRRSRKHWATSAARRTAVPAGADLPTLGQSNSRLAASHVHRSQGISIFSIRGMAGRRQFGRMA